MSAKPTHDITVKTGEYIDHEGNSKASWLRIGTVFKHDDGGTSIKLEALPTGLPNWEGWCSVFPRKERDPSSVVNRQQPQQQQHGYVARPSSSVEQGGFDDQIPF